MRRLVLTFLVLAGFVSTASAQTASERILAKAREIVRDSKDSTYDHATKIDEAQGVYHCDCSALVGYILKQVSPEHYASLLTHGKRRALAVHFYETFVGDPPAQPSTRPSTGRWLPIARVIDAQPGDVLAWRKVEMKPGDTTGHVAILASKAIAESPRLVRVEVIDSTSSAHADDTRPKGASGVGRGTVWFDVDEAGKPVGYHAHKRDSKAMIVPTSIGRAVDSPTTRP